MAYENPDGTRVIQNPDGTFRGESGPGGFEQVGEWSNAGMGLDWLSETNPDAAKRNPAGDTTPYYDVQRKYFDYTPDTGRMRRMGAEERGFDIGRYGPEVRDEMLGRIRGYESQAQMLQRAMLEDAMRSQLGAAGHAAPSSRAAALRGAQMGAAAQAQDIHLAARRHRLAEEMGMLGALGGVRSGDLRDELQRQAYEMDKAKLQQQYEQMGLAEKRYKAGLGARGEELQGRIASGYQASLLGRPEGKSAWDYATPIIASTAAAALPMVVSAFGGGQSKDTPGAAPRGEVPDAGHAPGYGPSDPYDFGYEPSQGYE